MLLQIAVSHDSAGIYTEAFIAGLAAEHSRLLEELEGVDMDSQPASPAASRMPSTAGKLAEMRASMTGALRVAASHNETVKLSVV